MTGSTAKLPVLRQSTAFERISHNLYMKVDSDPEVFARPALCARTAVFNAPDNLGNVYPGQQLIHEPEHRNCGTASCID